MSELPYRILYSELLSDSRGLSRIFQSVFMIIIKNLQQDFWLSAYLVCLHISNLIPHSGFTPYPGDVSWRTSPTFSWRLLTSCFLSFAKKINFKDMARIKKKTSLYSGAKLSNSPSLFCRITPLCTARGESWQFTT